MSENTVLATLNVRFSRNQWEESVVVSQKSYIYRCPRGKISNKVYFKVRKGHFLFSPTFT